MIFLVDDLGADMAPWLQDVRTHKITTAMSVARSEKFLVSPPTTKNGCVQFLD